MIKSYRYFTPALLLLLTELIIGTYVHDSFLRPYGGDFLIVILLYCFVKSFFYTPPIKTAACVLLFAYIIEALQYYHLTQLLGLQHSRAAAMLLGNSFSWMDILCYTLGIALVMIIEKQRIMHIAHSSKITANNPK
ncbi:MAG: hypothetical protein JWR38_3488 [Mucilaginibacter sp.]|nr:hypothetical protein [Mucilaginibacter sp.]